MVLCIYAFNVNHWPVDSYFISPLSFQQFQIRSEVLVGHSTAS